MGVARLLSANALALRPRAIRGTPSSPVEACAPGSYARVAFDLRGLDESLLKLIDRRDQLWLTSSPHGVSRPAPVELVLTATLPALRAVVAENPVLDPLLAAWETTHWSAPEPKIMGILNVTPDSFSDGGRFVEPEVAFAHGEQLVSDGADWIDVGGESTRPGAQPVPEGQELERVIPVVRKLAMCGHSVSIDTRKAGVARAAVEAGAKMINDISGGTQDPAMLDTAAELGCDLVLMHSQGDPASMQQDPRYRDPVKEVADFLRRQAAAAVAAGVAPGRLVLDPGIGFGKRLEHNLALIRRLDELVSLGFQVLAGLSRKSFIGHLTGAERQEEWQSGPRRDRPADRLGGSLAALTMAVQGGASLLRVHDVAPSLEAARVAFALCNHP
ncbi:MAG: dihydropteroate synthase [Planctomycetota bacterium]|nr:dihydropteroate synthase [Planctomycetota bacterium]